MEASVHFLVVPVNRQPDMGFWLQADSPEEARRLVSLNVPQMEYATNEGYATCEQDQTHSPPYGVIVEGSGRTFTIKKRY
ncbi:hypothetical protein MES5069_180038 [Mesorhizobium escarrei]|uniref:Uncharacterized protein n=1 Tax=Mesorhizobium escarrei TaxID=666018 RepID=A0ABM9DM15_9HYPH|nr:hypothetical protein MES5069_180038 [Mesorhizobium escarrei]